MCGYVTARGSWTINDAASSSTKSEYSHLICFGCHAFAHLSHQLNENIILLASDRRTLPSALLVSPVVASSMRHLRFTYKLSTGDAAQLNVKLIHASDYDGDLKSLSSFVDQGKAVQLAVFRNPPTFDDDQSEDSPATWTTGVVAIGDAIRADYRVIFELTSNEFGSGRIDGVVNVALDNVEFFERDLDTQFMLDDEDSEEELGSSEDRVCYPNKSPCDMPNRCALGAVCVNNASAAVGYSCICGFGYTGARCEERMDPCAPSLNMCLPNNTKECLRHVLISQQPMTSKLIYNFI